MRRVMRLALILIVVCAGAVIVALVLGRRQDLPLALLFTNPDGSQCEMPCLLGIRPGQTTLKDAIALLKVHPFIKASHAKYNPSQDIEPNVYTLTSPSLTLNLTIINGTDTRISDITLHFADPSLIPATAADVVALLGPPHAIQAGTDYVAWFNTAITVLFQPTSTVTSARPLQPYNLFAATLQLVVVPQQPVNHLQFGDQTYSLWVHTPMTNIAGQSWCGFTVSGCPGNPLGGALRYPYP